MKDKIIIFIVGLLLGAIISTASIYVYTLANGSNNNNTMQIPEGNRQEGQMGQMGPNGGNIPQMPGNNQNGAGI